MNFWRRFWGHFRTITRHRHMVILNCVKAGIPWQGLRHDLSKYTPAEFLQGVRYFDGTHSPTEDERKDLGYSIAWMHHKGRNPHHWEYWTDYSLQERRYVPVPVPRRYVAEMICDRIAASKVYRGSAYRDSDPYEYLMNGKLRDAMNSETLENLQRFLALLKDEGEQAMFAALRKWIREQKEKTA